MNRLVVVAPLKPGSEGRARELLDEGPPIDLENSRFDAHEVFVTAQEVIFSNADGIVDRGSAVSAFDKVGSRVKEIIELGTDDLKFAHADVYISRHSHRMLFAPVADWLVEVAGE